MSTLKDILCADENRPQVVTDATNLVDSEVKSKGGISGVAIKAGYKAVKTVKPSIIREAVDNLLDRFVEKLEPFYGDWVSGGKSEGFDTFLMARKTEVANALLSVTDDRAESVDNKTIRKAYEKLRPQGEKHVTEAMPGFSKLLAKYVT